ncbi:MAG: chloramphenicol acetyltransferase [Saprospiraceae bacterium]|nr:chloramphenicol acetyltransferase [Saprospiraceae bacterium]
MSKIYLNLSDWNRKEHFAFFNQMDQPFFGLTANVECTAAYRRCKASGQSFFLYYLHKCLLAANSIDNFRYRIEEGKVAVYDVIHASPTIGRADNTFGFSFLEYFKDFQAFQNNALPEIQRVKLATGLCLGEGANRADVIHFSSIPWVAFTSISHAYSTPHAGCIPKISVGKLIWQGEVALLPVSVFAHHALMDGYHTGLFFDRLAAWLSGEL